MCASPILALALLVAQTPAGAPPRDPPAATASPEAEAAPIRDRYGFSTFGGSLLADAPLVIEGTARSVRAGGSTVVVAQVKVEARLQALGGSVQKASREKSLVTVLATPGELVDGQRYLLFLRPFGKGQRFTVLRRIAEGDRDYEPKRRVLKRFTALNAIEDTTERAIAIRDALLAHLDDEVLFVRWNAHAELTEFIPRHRQLFDRDQRAALVAVYRAARSPTFQRAVGDLLKAVGVDLDGSGGGR